MKQFLVPTDRKGWAVIEAPEDEMPEMIASIGPGWRTAKIRERIWFALKTPRFSWLDYFLLIFVLSTLDWLLRNV